MNSVGWLGGLVRYLPLSEIIVPSTALSTCSPTAPGKAILQTEGPLIFVAAYLNQVPWDKWLNVPSRRNEGKLLFFFNFG